MQDSCLFPFDAGTVTVENMGLGGVTVRLSGMGEGQTTTDDSGQYSFTGLRAGTYSVEISSFDTNEVSFSSTSGAATVGVGESKVVSFDGTYLRTAGIQGQVTVDGEGLQGVTVTLQGEGEDRTETTNAAGQYAFSQLKSGTYQIGITNPDPDDYEFATTSKTATIATGEVANVPFEGTLLRTAGIAGRVSVEGMGLDGVTVTLAGAEEREAMTANGGQYSFAGLAAGTYVLTIANPNETAYNFADDEMQKTVVLEDDQSAIVNFSGTHTRTASISGVLFIDEVMDDKERNDGEPTITEALGPWLASLADDDPAKAAVGGLLASATVTLRGPDLNTKKDIAIMPDGSFTTGETLMAGSYQVELPANDEDIAAGLDMAGVAFVGGSQVVTVEAGGSATADFPFEITKQTLTTAAHMGAGDVLGVAVPGVELALFARADMTGDPLDKQTTDDMGRATFNFDRDANTGPAGNDNIVFVKVMDDGSDALEVSGNEFVEIVYEATERLSVADAQEVATLVNVAAAFDFWVKSNENARDGDMGLGGWQVQYCMPMAKTDDADAVVCEGDDASFNTIMVGEGDDAEPMVTDDGEDNMANLGKASFATAVDPTMLPAMFYVRVTPVAVADDGKRTSKQPDMGEKWEASGALMHTHTGLDLPPGEDDMATDLGPIRITYTTQTIYVGVHRELDDRTGFTDYFGVDGERDGRPTGTAKGEIDITLMTSDSRGRLRVLEYDDDFNDMNDDVRATKSVGASGMVSFKKVPADLNITVVADEPGNMVIVPDSRASKEIDAFGDQLADYPDGVIKGAFGDMSGARPDVWLCPLQRQEDDDPNKVCSTYAYKWEDGTIEGKVTGLRKGDEDVVISLNPVRSNDEYEDDLAQETKVDYSATGTTYSFSDVADGQYEVVLEARAGSWREHAVGGIVVVHDEDNSKDDYTGEVVTKDLSATDLRGTIRGVIGNNSNGRGGLTGNESRAGVVVNIHYAKKASSGDKAYQDAGAVKDADGNARSEETNDDGEYTFEDLATDTIYLLKPQETDLYKAVRNGDPKVGGAKKEKTTDVVPHALAEADVPDPNYEPGVPSWDYYTSTATVGDHDFVLLYKDGEAGGEAEDPGAEKAHQDAVIELTRCRTVEDTDTGTDGVQPGDECDDEAGEDEIEVSVDEDGNWDRGGLMEGAYQVEIDLPSGYELVEPDGTSDDQTAITVRQVILLKGSRADPETDPAKFYLRKRNSSDDVALATTNPVRADGENCTAGAVCVHSKDGSVDVTVSTADDDATIVLSPDDTDPKATGAFGVPNGEKKAVSLNPGQLRGFYVHVTSESGYGKTGTPISDEYAIRRNADARLKAVRITWSGDGLNLTRDDLNLDPDGETPPTTGVTDLTYTVSKGDGGNDVPTAETTLTFTATGMGNDDNTAHWFAADATTGVCSATESVPSGAATTTSTAALTASVSGGDKGSAAICLLVLDRNSTADAETLDRNDANFFRYRITLTRAK